MPADQPNSNNTPIVVEAPQKPLCFVIGPIGRDGSDERKHADLLLYTVIKHVLEAPEFGYSVKRADESADPGMIGDRMVTDIIHAELVIADLTDLNANAFYELGIRHSAVKPTIHVAKAETKLPFDNSAHRAIFVDLTDWSSIENARKRLADSVRHIRTPGYLVSNPITQANASFKMRESADPHDRVLANMQDQLSSIQEQLGGERYLARAPVMGVYELSHLENLAADEPFYAELHSSFLEELRKLLALGLIDRRPARGIRTLERASVPRDIKDHFEITDKGRRILASRRAA